MSEKLSCHVVRDLLPSYAEGLTEEETSRAVSAHLADCTDCAARYAAMTAPTPETERTEEKQVDYLKTVRRKTWKKVALAALAALGAAVLCAVLFLFVIGSSVDGNQIYVGVEEQPDQNVLRIQFTQTDSAKCFAFVHTHSEDGAVIITGRAVLASPWNRSGDGWADVALDETREVWAFGRLVWKDGVQISREAGQIFNARTPYVGDAPAVGRLLGQIGQVKGMMPPVPYSMKLQTEREPYGMIIQFSESMPRYQLDQMHSTAMLLLALVDNLGEVRWSCPGYDEFVLTTQDAAQLLAEIQEKYQDGLERAPWTQIKKYGRSVYGVELLLP